MADIIQIRRGTAVQWSSTNPILADGELGFETDSKKGKLGTGIASWNDLPYSWTGQVFDINSAPSKTTPIDADKLGITDSEVGGIFKSVTWASIKATLKYYFDNIYSSTTGTVTSVAATAPTGFSVAGTPITSNGTIAISFASGYSLPTIENQTNWGAAYTHSQATTGAVHGSTTVGEALLRLANPSAIRFLRINTDNTATLLTAADFLIAIGAAASAHNQNASTITAGTFGTGNFIFSKNLKINGQIGSGFANKGNRTGATEIDFNQGNIQLMVLVGNVTLTFVNAVAGSSYQIIITQDATSGRTITWPTIHWEGKAAPSLTGTANSVDVVTLTYDGAKYLGVMAKNFGTA